MFAILANYQAVVDAKSKVPSDLSIYTFASVMELKFALANVQEGLPISRQDEVDAMAQAINDAIDALEKKPVDKDESTNDQNNIDEINDKTNDKTNDKEEAIKTGDTTNVVGLLALLSFAGVGNIYTTRKI